MREVLEQVRGNIETHDNRFVGTLKLMTTGLRDKSHPVINKNVFLRK